jgi:hypothetical protein
MSYVAGFVVRCFILNSVQLMYAVVRFIVRRLTSLYNYYKCLVARSVARRVVYFLIQFKCCVTPHDNPFNLPLSAYND